MAGLLLIAGTGSSKGREEHYHPPQEQAPAFLSYRQELKPYSSEHQAPHWKHRHLVSQRCRISDITPQPAVRQLPMSCASSTTSHLSELSPQQLTHPPAKVPSERRDSRTGSSGRATHHTSTVLSTKHQYQAVYSSIGRPDYKKMH